MCIRNISAKEIKIPAKTVTGQVQVANVIPPMLAPKKCKLDEPEVDLKEEK